MKFKLEKDCVGLRKGEEINIAEDKVRRMVQLGYIKTTEADPTKIKSVKSKKKTDENTTS